MQGYPPNENHTAEGAALFRPTGFEHVPLITWRITSPVVKQQGWIAAITASISLRASIERLKRFIGTPNACSAMQLLHDCINHDAQAFGAWFNSSRQSLQIAGLGNRVAGFGYARHHCDLVEAGQLRLRLHCHAVVERELQRQVFYLFAQHGKQRFLTLRIARENEHGIGRCGFAGQCGA